MEKENKADLCSVLVKLGLAVMSVAYPQTGSQASLASAGVDVVLSVVKSVGLLKEEKDDSIDGQLKECIANVLARIQSSRLSDTHRKLMENYIVPRYESWRGNCVKGVPADDIESLFLEWTNTGEANREMYLTELDIRSIDDLFMVLFKEELFKHQGLADWYEMQQIESLDQRFNEVCNLFWGRMGTLEDRISKLENPINPKIEEILRSNPRELLWEASKSVYEISKQEGQRFAYDIIDRLLPNGYIPTVYFDDITLIPLPDDIVTNGNFANDLTSWSTWTENGSTYSVDAGEQCFVANIPTTLPNPWSAQLYQVIDVPAAGSYRVTFKAKASMNREIRLALEKDGQSPLMDETMSVSADWTNYSYDFTASSAASGVKLVFMLGNVGTTENMAHTISIDDISLYKIS